MTVKDMKDREGRRKRVEFVLFENLGEGMKMRKNLQKINESIMYLCKSGILQLICLHINC